MTTATISNKFRPFGKRQPRFSEDQARFVINESGHILYASKAFSILINQNPDKVKGELLTDHIEFINPDDALRTQALFGRHNGCYIELINEGRHNICFPCQPQKAETIIQFDKISGPNGKRYVVGSEVRDGQNPVLGKDFT